MASQSARTRALLPRLIQMLFSGWSSSCFSMQSNTWWSTSSGDRSFFPYTILKSAILSDASASATDCFSTALKLFLLRVRGSGAKPNRSLSACSPAVQAVDTVDVEETSFILGDLAPAVRGPPVLGFESSLVVSESSSTASGSFSMTINGSPCSFMPPTTANKAATFPATSATTGISIFIASSTTSVCPACTTSPTCTGTSHTLPDTYASTSFTVVPRSAAIFHLPTSTSASSP
mmetsp:Transcript_16920/g.41953  ORF Transcript_16920/g.41953 Transcript_16920/m.41953 type:complete len:234 (+) Transcript_16920:1625-2326(+)